MQARALATLLAVLAATSCDSTSPSNGPSDSPSNGPSTPPATEAAPSASDASAASNTPPSNPAPSNMNDVYALKTQTLDGQPADLSQYRGKVTLMVNVASECGYTPQYAGLQKLHEEFSSRGFAVLGFPSNEFGGQEPGTAEQIQQFCSSRFGVTFPMFAKLETKAGAGQSPIYATLSAATKQLPNWNFCKYLVGKDGQPIAFYPSKTAPDSAELRTAIEQALR